MDYLAEWWRGRKGSLITAPTATEARTLPAQPVKVPGE
jgi:hypothetical protein